MKKTLFLFIFFVVFGCDNHKKENHNIDLKVYRFENEFFSINDSNVFQKTEHWDTTYHSFLKGAFIPFLQSFVNNARPQSIKDSVLINELMTFANHDDFKEVYDSLKFQFSDFSETERYLEKAFGNFFHFFPNSKLEPPNITTFFSGFNYGAFTYPGKDIYTYHIGIGLDYFMGSDSKFYSILGYPHYERYRFQRKFIPVYVMQVWFDMCYEDNFNQSMIGTDLLTQTIYIGKKMYFIDKILPNIPMHDKLGYSEKQLEWVINNETNIWSYIIENELLFSKDETKFRQFIYDGPFIKGLPKEAPTRLMYYIGYKIIENYSKQKKISINELLENNLEPEEYLQNYKPENNNIVKKTSLFSNYLFKIVVVVFILIFSLLLYYRIKNFLKNEKKNRI